MSGVKRVDLVHPKTGHHYTSHLAQVEVWLKRGWQRVPGEADGAAAADNVPATKPAKKTTTPAVAPADAPKEG